MRRVPKTASTIYIVYSYSEEPHHLASASNRGVVFYLLTVNGFIAMNITYEMYKAQQNARRKGATREDRERARARKDDGRKVV